MRSLIAVTSLDHMFADDQQIHDGRVYDDSMKLALWRMHRSLEIV